MGSSQAEGAVTHGWDLPTSSGQLLKAAAGQTKAFWLHFTVEQKGITDSDSNDMELIAIFLFSFGKKRYQKLSSGKRKKSQINSQSEHLNQMTESL